ncbi:MULTISPECIES: recombinase family protein [unclassified Arthrobacter]|uniref:recombinase family protein n=1 Tax=unclassified Arthrobacter TaxID=235627 RepID=UPI001C865989|nr:recombinase family protein [Arthrobacter sp. MAHUQ-56]
MATVSTVDQNAELQHAAWKVAGCHRIFADRDVSGSRARRPALNKMLDHLRDGDEDVVGRQLNDIVSRCHTQTG